MRELGRRATLLWSQRRHSCWRAAQKLPSTLAACCSRTRCQASIRTQLAVPPSLSPLGSRRFQRLWTRHILSRLSLQQKFLVYLKPTDTFLFQLISLLGRKTLFAARVSLALHGCEVPNKTGPFVLELLEVHSIEIKNNLATWLSGYRLPASLQISNQLDEHKILCLGSAIGTIFMNTVLSREMTFQMHWQELQVQVKWSK